MEERFTQIETENRLLLEKMSHIMRVRKFLALQIAIGKHVFWRSLSHQLIAKYCSFSCLLAVRLLLLV